MSEEGGLDDVTATVGPSPTADRPRPMVQSLGPDHAQVAGAHTDLANVLDDEGRYDEALAHYEQGLEISERALGAQHPGSARARANLGTVLIHQGKYALAQTSLESALAVWQAAYGPDHRTVAMAMNSLDDLHNQRGERGHRGRRVAGGAPPWRRPMIGSWDDPSPMVSSGIAMRSSPADQGHA